MSAAQLMLNIATLALAVIVAVVSGDAALPRDFQLTYRMNMGSAPPDQYYEYTLSVNAHGQGEFAFTPAYGGPVAWTEKFKADPAALQKLWKQVLDAGILTRHWRQPPSLPVGGIWRTVYLRAKGKSVSVPAYPERTEGLGELYDTIRALVPSRIWSKLRRQRKDWEEHFSREAP